MRSEVNIKIMCIASTENPKKKKKKICLKFKRDKLVVSVIRGEERREDAMRREVERCREQGEREKEKKDQARKRKENEKKWTKGKRQKGIIRWAKHNKKLHNSSKSEQRKNGEAGRS